MKHPTQKLAAAALAAAASAPMAASALPNINTLQQASNSVDATFSNIFSQSVGADVSITPTYTTNGAGIANTSAYNLVNNAAALSIGASGGMSGTIALPSVTAITASLGGVGQTGLLQITGVTATGATSLGITQSVFGVDTIRATQSVIDSTTTTLF